MTALFIGVMTGSSLDGVDVALVELDGQKCKVIATHFLPYDADTKDALLALHFPAANEIELSAICANKLALHYTDAINTLLKDTSYSHEQIAAIGCHGQTIRHCPQKVDGIGYTSQIGNHALLAERTNITVIGDFRTRDIAAGGQGAPLVPAFHKAVFGEQSKNRAIINIGGIANITYLPQSGDIIGFDSGPGNMLLDTWTKLNLDKDYDANGGWATTGAVHEGCLRSMLNEPYFALKPPKSTGRDLFNVGWLKHHIADINCPAADIARTLVRLSAQTIQQSIDEYCPALDEIYLCGGGAHNQLLVSELKALLPEVDIASTNALGVDSDWVEAVAFAWLAKQTLDNVTSNLPAVTGAVGPRILGAIYPH